MNTSKKNDGLQPPDKIFALADAFPNAQEIFDFEYDALESIKDDCLVGLDANVLLLPYEMRSNSISEIIKIYEKLNGRIIIPAQAAREFAKHRASKIEAMAKHLRDKASTVSNSCVELEAIGYLEGSKKYSNAREISTKLKNDANSLSKKLNEIVSELPKTHGSDDISKEYRKVFNGSVVGLNLSDSEKEKFSEDLLNRYDNKIPPGYKDKNKENGGGGDLIIWKTILKIAENQKENFIFVTADDKNDWRIGGKARIELVEEYKHASGGKTIHIIQLSDLLKLYKAEKKVISNTRDLEKVHRYEMKRKFEKNLNIDTHFDNPSLHNYEYKFNNYQSLMQEKHNLIKEKNYLLHKIYSYSDDSEGGKRKTGQIPARALGRHLYELHSKLREIDALLNQIEEGDKFDDEL